MYHDDDSRWSEDDEQFEPRPYFTIYETSHWVTYDEESASCEGFHDSAHETLESISEKFFMFDQCLHILRYGITYFRIDEESFDVITKLTNEIYKYLSAVSEVLKNARHHKYQPELIPLEIRMSISKPELDVLEQLVETNKELLEQNQKMNSDIESIRGQLSQLIVHIHKEAEKLHHRVYDVEKQFPAVVRVAKRLEEIVVRNL